VTRATRKVRYGSASGLIVLGFACGAISTGTIGGALATGFIAIGMLLFLAFLFRDLGLSDGSGHASRRPGTVAPPPTSAPSRPESQVEDPRTTPRTRATVQPPERLRGQRGRLR
jgi:hypothetical protein